MRKNQNRTEQKWLGLLRSKRTNTELVCCALSLFTSRFLCYSLHIPQMTMLSFPGVLVSYLLLKPRPHQQPCRSNIVECYKWTILSTKSKQIKYVQFVSSLSKGRNFTINSFDIVAVFGNNVERCFDIVAGADKALLRCFSYLKTVTHFITNRAIRWITTVIETNASPPETVIYCHNVPLLRPDRSHHRRHGVRVNGLSSTDGRSQRRPRPVLSSHGRRLTTYRRRCRVSSTRYRRNRTTTSAGHNYDAVTLRCRRIRLIFGRPQSGAAVVVSPPRPTLGVAAIIPRHALY